MSRSSLKFLLWLLTLTPINVLALSDDDVSWPREIIVDEGTVIIYQPQPEKRQEDRIFARAAIALELHARTEPVFGAIWFNAQVLIDRDERTATFLDVNITRVRFPNEDESKALKLSILIEEKLPQKLWSIDLDNLITTMTVVEEQARAAEKLNVDPPNVLFVNEPAVLISIDGDPQIRDEDGVNRVINTPYTLVQDPENKLWYLNAGDDNWYGAKEITDEWQVANKVPTVISKLAPPPADKDELEDTALGDEETGAQPRIIVVTEPTELISSDGKPEFSAIEGTDLLYLSNTDSDVLMDIKEQLYYVLLSGRWYSSKSTQGPWVYVNGDDLPEDFPNIPEASEMSTVLYAVPGTIEAEEAMLDAQIPQTASVDRKKASLEVEYDGAPTFTPIEGVEKAELNYATNTATPVIRFNSKYYAVDEAVWFVASTPTGKWVVATEIPAEIYTIPPESALYNVTFVRIYSYDQPADVVYVGYTQGYTNVYIYNTTVVYGTGYYYPGWYGRYYYPRPSTWGFHVRYNPRWGWSFGLSYSTGPFTFHIGRGGWYRGGWWGPSRYRGYRSGYRHGRRSGYRAGYRAGQRNANRNNMYRSQKNQARTRPASTQGQQRAQSKATTNRANNVYADRNGNVHRNTDKGWEQKTKDGWSREKAQGAKNNQQNQQRSQQQNQQQRQQQTQQSQQRSSQNRASTQQQLNRSYQARQRGTQRSMRGGSRGGGRRR